jgi:hypothetical protein
MEEENNNDDYDDDSHENLEDKYKHYFKFDPDAWDAWGKMLYDALNDIVETSPNTWIVYGNKFPVSGYVPVNSWNPNTGKDKYFQYLGSNYQGQPIWKSKYFVINPVDQIYRSHLKANAIHFLKQPHYYKGMFDILN